MNEIFEELSVNFQLKIFDNFNNIFAQNLYVTHIDIEVLINHK